MERFPYKQDFLFIRLRLGLLGWEASWKILSLLFTRVYLYLGCLLYTLFLFPVDSRGYFSRISKGSLICHPLLLALSKKGGCARCKKGLNLSNHTLVNSLRKDYFLDGFRVPLEFWIYPKKGLLFPISHKI